MPKKLQHSFVTLSLSVLLAHAANAAVVEVEQQPAQDVRAAVIAQDAPAAQSGKNDKGALQKAAAPSPVPEASSWSMLLVGAGVLLLPRRRRQDNKFD
jgi:hypothetical protein